MKKNVFFFSQFCQMLAAFSIIWCLGVVFNSNKVPPYNRNNNRKIWFDTSFNQCIHGTRWERQREKAARSKQVFTFIFGPNLMEFVLRLLVSKIDKRSNPRCAHTLHAQKHFNTYIYGMVRNFKNLHHIWKYFANHFYHDDDQLR